MAPKFKLSAQRFRYTPSGIKEFSQEINSEPQYLLFCDAIPVDDTLKFTPPYDPKSPITVVEDAVAEKMRSLPPEKINEMALFNTLQYANYKLVEFLRAEKSNLLISAILVAINPYAVNPSTQEKGVDLIFAGVGDSRVYQIDPEGVALSFFDPRNPFLASYCSAQRRLTSLENALGASQTIHPQCRRIFKNDSQRYLIASCGIYQQATEKELHDIGIHPEKPHQGAAEFILNCQSKENDLYLIALSLENPQAPLKFASKMEHTTSSPNNRRRMKKYTGIGAVAALIVTLSLVFFDGNKDKKALAEASKSHPEFIALLKQAEQQSKTIDSLKELIEAKSQELDNLKDELGKFSNQNIEESFSTESIEQASKAIDELNELLKEREEKVREIALVPDKEKKPVSKQASSALSEVNQQLKMQYQSLQSSLSQRGEAKKSMDKVVRGIKQNFAKKETLTGSSKLAQDQLAQETRDLSALIISLQKSTLAQIESNKKQIAQAIKTSREKTIKQQEMQEATAVRARVHTVQAGDTLKSISTEYYGTSKRWQEILEANQDVLNDENQLKEGMKLVIP